MFSPKKFLFSLLFCGQLMQVASASPQTSSTIKIPKLSGEITIDAKLDEPAWKNATRVSIDNVTRPYDNLPSPVKTEALLMENDGVFYIAFIAEDPDPSKIRAFLRDRDRSWGDDLVGIKIDSFNDQRTAYRFMVNPLGTQIDGIESEVTKKESDSWDGIWESAGEINENGFVVEIALPLRILNFNEKVDIQKWGIELIRMYPRNENLRISNIYLDRGNNCEICQLATAEGFQGAKQGSNLVIAPSFVAGANESRNDDGEWERDNNTEPSLDVRWGITPDILLNATINPDFSTVETDSARLNINNNFALFYEEKRPFFLDNADYFDSNYNLVYTRNINAPNYGAKLTGRQGDHSLGLFLTDDSTTNILIPGNRSSAIAEIDGESKATALRYRYNYDENITLGWISTMRTAKDYSNIVHGIDARARLSTYDVIKFQSLYSDTEYPADLFEQFCDADDPSDCTTPEETEDCNREDGCDYNEKVLRTLKDEPFKGDAFRAGYYHTSSDWHFKASIDKQNSGFRGDLGFIPRVDQSKVVIGGHRKWYANPGDWWTQFKIYGDWDQTENDAGEKIEEEAEISFNLSAQYNSFLKFQYTTRDRVGTREDKSSLAIDGNTTMFKENQYSIFGEAKPIIGLYFNTYLAWGDAIDFANNRLGQRREVSPRLNWNINKHLEIKFNQVYRELDADDDKVFVARLTDIRTTYQFNVQSFLRLSVIYNNTDRNPDNYIYSDPEDITAKQRDFSTELLYAYKVNPQTVLYLGYSDHSYTEEEFMDLEQDERSVFAKVSYAWIK